MRRKIGAKVMTITEQTINEIKTLDPVQVITYYTGSQVIHGKMLCPFHNDKHPSLSVKGNRWRCWSCDMKGDVIDFARQYFGIDFKDAVIKLANDFGIAVSSEQENKEQIAWNRIKSDSDKENKAQLRTYLDTEIDKLNACYRALLKHGSPDWILKQYEEELDSLIQDRSRLGESDWKTRLTPTEQEISEQLRRGKNGIDRELQVLLSQ